MWLYLAFQLIFLAAVIPRPGIEPMAHTSESSES